MDSEPRHEGHHHTLVHVKYGYIVFGVSLVYAALLTAGSSMYVRQWDARGKPHPTLVWGRLRNTTPLWVHVVVWLVAVAALAAANGTALATDYVAVARRLGRLGFCLVPLSILLALRPPILGTSYLEYVALHKWLLRVIFAATAVHGVGYWIKWLREGMFWAKNLSLFNLLGVVAALALAVLAVVSARPLRHRFYRTFYVVHNVTVVLYIVLIAWHARPGAGDFVALSVLMVVWQVVQRIRRVHRVAQVDIIDHDRALLRLLRIARPVNYPVEWSPGSHLRLGYPLRDVRSYIVPLHPYTICLLPMDKTIDLVVKKGRTFEVFLSLQYAVSQPFASLPPPFFSTAENVVVLCGGSGVSLGCPIYRHLQTAGVRSKMVWCVANKDDVYVLDEVNVANVEVYVTRTLAVEPTEEDEGLLRDVELQNLDELGDDPFADPERESAVSFHTGRPSLDSIFAQFGETDEQLNKWIVVCGPSLMIKDAQRWGKQHLVQVFSEYYDM